MTLPLFDFHEDFSMSQMNMDEEEMFNAPFNIDDMFDGVVSSIQSDLAKIESRECLDYFDDMEDMKPEIRNGDCMWSASSSCHSNGSAANNNSAASSYSDGIAIPLSIVTGGANPYQCQQEEQQQQQQQKQNSGTKPGAGAVAEEDLPVIIKQEPLDDYLPSVEKRARLSVSEKAQTQSESTAYVAADQLIPPGGSLLRKRNVLLQANQRYKMGPTVTETKPPTKYLRPDTPPHSIPDESAPGTAPMFRHNVDLRACVMGSNNICLTSDGDVSCINQISRELQNASKTLFSLFPVPEINDVMDVLSQDSQQQSQQSLQSLSIQQALEAAANATTVKVSPPNSSSDYDSDDETYRDMHKSTMLMRHISDHSYTRCNELDDRHAPETPSDSDEEIDVVSFPDKKQLQFPVGELSLLEKVAHQISNGINQKKQRYGNYIMPYTPASSSPVKSVANSRYPSPSSTPYQASSQSYSPLTVDSSNASSSSSSSSSSGYGCGGLTKVHKRYYLKFSGSGNGNTTASSSAGNNGMSVHKMASNSSSSSSSNNNSNNNSSSRIISKKCRSKKSSPSSSSSSELGSPVSSTEADASNNWMNEMNSTMNRIPKHNSTANVATLARSSQRFSVDEADTIEKRNQHNDMERQRRIGLKNLFEALKKQIPTIRDKERAPKVNILREAAKLCEQLTHEEHDLAMEYQRLKEKNRKRQELLVRLRAASTVHTVTDESRKWVGQRPK